MNSRCFGVAVVAAHAVAWGLWIGLVTGAAAGTAIYPLVGSMVGGFYGLVVSVIPTILGMPVVVVVARRHRRPDDPSAFAADLQRIARGIFAILVVIGVTAVSGLTGYLMGDRLGDGDSVGGLASSVAAVIPVVPVVLWLAVGPLLVAIWTVDRLLRRAVLSLTKTFTRCSATPVTPRLSPAA